MPNTTLLTMSRLTSWFRGGASATLSDSGSGAASPSKAGASSASATPAASSTTSVNRQLADPPSAAAKQLAELQAAMSAAELIMNDDAEGAESLLQQSDSSFHQLGLGVSIFMRSVLGWEKKIMSEASAQLAQAENQAWADMKRAQQLHRDGTWNPGEPQRLYPPGTEYAIVHAESQLMSAVVAVLHESLSEALKGFYRLRKAYITLDSIIASETTVLAKAKDGGGKVDGGTNRKATGSAGLALVRSNDTMPGSFDDSEFADVVAIDKKASVTNSTDEAEVSAPVTITLNDEDELQQPTGAGELDTLSPSSTMYANPVDAFVHSGANMAFGTMQLILSMVPPAFSRLLYVIGFKGDRERGIAMLWASTRFPNINGAVAALMLLGYYNGLLAYADILPPEPSDDDSEWDSSAPSVAFPRARCAALLNELTARYPESGLWRLEQARVLANSRRLGDAMKALVANMPGGTTDASGPQSRPRNRMRQVTALNAFELSICAMFAQDWQLMRDSFLQCRELNDWSHALYLYLAGCAEIEMYRDAFHRRRRLLEEHPELAEGSKDGSAATPLDASTTTTTTPDASSALLDQLAELTHIVAKHSGRAAELLREAPTVAGKKRMMSRQLPFEIYVVRKVGKWEARAKELGLDLVDAVGPSPALEMAYLWNGMKRMDDGQMDGCRENAAWERLTGGANVVDRCRGEKDEAAIEALIRVSVLRTRGKIDEAREVLEGIVAIDRYVF